MEHHQDTKGNFMGAKVKDWKEYIERRSIPLPMFGCWLWEGCTVKGGYGLAELLGKRMTAHRISYAAFNNGIPDGLDVLHKCDVPSCVNPLHLYDGTDQDNTNDKIERGRFNAGKHEKKDFCKYGHPTTEPWQRTKNRSCMVCCKAVWHKRSVERNINRKQATEALNGN